MPQSSPMPAARRAATVDASVRLLVRREARLRPEYAGHYPGIQAGVWESAAVLSDRVLAGGLLRGSPLGWRVRVLAPEHFEFRGDAPEGERPLREDR
jgi:hypothetical protein